MEKKTKIRLIACLSIFGAIVVSMLITLAFSSQIEKNLGIAKSRSAVENCTFRYDVIDVGQGASSLLTLENGEYVLIDAGTNSSEKVLVNYLKKLGISTINYFVITHSDNDHTGGADAIYNNFDVLVTYRPFILAENSKFDEDPLLYYENILPEVTKCDTADWAKCVSLMYTETYLLNGSEKQSEVRVISDQGVESVFGSEECVIRFFWPNTNMTYRINGESSNGRNKTYGYATVKCDSTNDYSPIILVKYQSKSIVITGDASQSVEKKVLLSLESSGETNFFRKVDVYVAGHHGSYNSSCQDFLDVLLPSMVVVQCGKSNSHPHKSFLERVSKTWQDNLMSGTLYRTDKNSDVVFEFDGTNSLETKMGVYYNGSAFSYDLHWWQIVVMVIGVSAVFLLVPIIPNKRKIRRGIHKI